MSANKPLPPRDPNRRDQEQGLYRKYHVERSDGSSAPGEKHYHCEYFVLDLTCDKFAREALLAYANACKHEFPQLANDLVMRYKL